MTWFNRQTPTPQQQVTHAIDKLERSNALIVRLAHFFAFALIIATSIASLISLAADLLIAVLAGHGTVATDASVAITLLLVMAMDVGMVLAATYIRIGRQRGESLRALSGHLSIMVIVALLEAGTYTYMLFLYEHPHNWISWVLIIARGFAVPLLSIYLSMAQEITVKTEDIARLTEVVSGVGLLRDLVEQANDNAAPLDKKIAVYRAAATLSPAQRAKLDAMYLAVTGQPMPRMIDAPRIVESMVNEGTDTASPRQSQPLAFNRRPDAVKAPSGQGKRASEYDIDSSELKAYILPPGVELDTMGTQEALSMTLGTSTGALSEALRGSGLDYYPPEPGQAKNAKNWQVWQILALVESERLTLPSNIQRAA